MEEATVESDYPYCSHLGHLFTSGFMSVVKRAASDLTDTSFNLSCGFEPNMKTSGAVNKPYFALLPSCSLPILFRDCGGQDTGW